MTISTEKIVRSWLGTDKTADDEEARSYKSWIPLANRDYNRAPLVPERYGKPWTWGELWDRAAPIKGEKGIRVLYTSPHSLISGGYQDKDTFRRRYQDARKWSQNPRNRHKEEVELDRLFKPVPIFVINEKGAPKGHLGQRHGSLPRAYSLLLSKKDEDEYGRLRSGEGFITLYNDADPHTVIHEARHILQPKEYGPESHRKGEEDSERSGADAWNLNPREQQAYTGVNALQNYLGADQSISREQMADFIRDNMAGDDQKYNVHQADHQEHQEQLARRQKRRDQYTSDMDKFLEETLPAWREKRDKSRERRSGLSGLVRRATGNAPEIPERPKAPEYGDYDYWEKISEPPQQFWHKTRRHRPATYGPLKKHIEHLDQGPPGPSERERYLQEMSDRVLQMVKTPASGNNRSRDTG